jgi:hypothetical protein
VYVFNTDAFLRTANLVTSFFNGIDNIGYLKDFRVKINNNDALKGVDNNLLNAMYFF